MIPSGRIAFAFALAALVGCDELSIEEEPTTEDETYAALQAETLALRDAAALLEVTDPADLPLDGGASYEGTALIALEAPADGVASELIGTATLTADFAAATVSGEASGFHGTVNGAEVAAFDGQLFLSQGAIDASGSGADQIGADVNGALQGDGDTLVVNGTVAGNFLGEPALLNEPPEALSLETGDDTAFTLNGADVAGEMEIVATVE